MAIKWRHSADSIRVEGAAQQINGKRLDTNKSSSNISLLLLLRQ